VKAFPEFCFIGSGTCFAGHWSLNVSANGRFFYLFSFTHPNALLGPRFRIAAQLRRLFRDCVTSDVLNLTLSRFRSSSIVIRLCKCASCGLRSSFQTNERVGGFEVLLTAEQGRAVGRGP
jgi:hypothetical protein